MNVHIDEVHSDVVPLPATSGQPAGPRQADPPWAAEECWRDERDRAGWLARRVCAVDFDD